MHPSSCDLSTLTRTDCSNLTIPEQDMVRFLVFDWTVPLGNEPLALAALNTMFPKESTSERKRAASIFANCKPCFDRPLPPALPSEPRRGLEREPFHPERSAGTARNEAGMSRR